MKRNQNGPKKYNQCKSTTEFYKYNATNGWFLTDILGLHDTEDLSDIKNILVTVPMTISDRSCKTNEELAFIGGIVGYLVTNSGQHAWPSISAYHSWTLCLEPDSIYLDKINAA